MPGHDIVVIGGSAGSITALQSLIAEIPSRLAAAVFVVVHTTPDTPTVLDQILSRAGELPVVIPEDKQRIQPGRIYVASPDRHMLLALNLVRSYRGPRENRQRPSIDVLFRSAARFYGARVAGVLLSGYLDDGVAGLEDIQRRGGIAIVQNPEEAIAPDLPQRALQEFTPSFVLDSRAIGRKLVELVGTASGAEKPTELPITLEGPPSPFSCPECGGVLWEVEEGRMAEFRCRVGHRYTEESMAEDQEFAVERALWAALRALEEQTQLSERLARQARLGRRGISEERYRSRADESRQHAGVIRRILIHDLEAERAQLESEGEEAVS